MAAASGFSATDGITRQELREYGHDIYIDFSFTNAILIPDDWKVFYDVIPVCEDTPTTWKVRITLDRFPKSQVVSGTAKIQRLDCINKVVRTIFELKVYHPEFGYHIPVPEYKGVFECRTTSMINIPNIVPSSHTNLLRDKLYLSFRFSIRECHRPVTPPPKPPSPVKVSPKKPPKVKSPPPKKQLEFGKRWHPTQR